MNYEKIRVTTDVLTTFKKIEDDEIEGTKSKTKNLRSNNDENFENLNKIFGNLPIQTQSSLGTFDQTNTSDNPVQRENSKNATNGIISIVQPNPNRAKSTNFIKNPTNMSQSQGKQTFESSTSTQSKIHKSPSLTSMSSILSNSNEPPQESNLSRAPISNNDNKYNISNVLKHIYQIKYFQKSNQITTPTSINNGSAESNTNSSKQFWMPDDQVKDCFECNEKFTTFRRRHHCRVCGQIFCSKCSTNEIPSNLIYPNSTGNIRACTFCHSFVGEMEKGNADLKNNTKSIRELMKRLSLSPSNFYYSKAFASSNTVDLSDQSSYMKNSDSVQFNSSMENAQILTLLSAAASTGSSPSLTNLDSNVNGPSANTLTSLSMSTVSNSVNNNSQISTSQKFSKEDENNPFDVTEKKDLFKSHETEIKQLIINNSLELRNLWVLIYHTSGGLTFSTRSINKFKKLNNCITGSELVEWLMKNKSHSKDQAIVIGQALVHGKWLECAYQNNQTANSSNYYSNQKQEQSQIFYDDNSFYRPGPAALNCNRTENLLLEKKKAIQDSEEGPEWIKELNKLVSNIEDETSSTNEKHISNETENDSTESKSADSRDSQSLDENESKLLNEKISIPIVKVQNIANFIDEAPLANMTIITSENVSNLSLNSLNVVNSLSKSSSSSSLNFQGINSNYHTKQKQENQIELPATKTLNNVNDNLQQIHRHLQTEVLKQLLKLKNISFEWFDIILPIVWKCVDLVKPDVKHDNDSMDIRNYIKIKKLPGNTKKDCQIINGLVFTKNIAHKKMQNNIKNPKILLLRSSIEYQRSEKLVAIESLITTNAETQYLRNYCSKLLLRQNPDILIVEKSVARVAQECFLNSGINLILNVKNVIMEKLSRVLQAEPMFNIDDLVRKPKLGFCSHFHVDTFQLPDRRTKSLMFFEGTPTNLGCTLLLSGGNVNELSLVKHIIKFMIYVVYNSKLEQSFILDKYADFSIKNTMFEVSTSEGFFELDRKKENIQKKNEQESDEEVSKKEKSASNEAIKTTHLEKKEISIDQSPLDFSTNSQDETSQFFPKNVNNKEKTNEDEFKLTICEQHREKFSAHLNRNFKLLIDDLILSCSPFIRYNMPYLLIENSADKLKPYLPTSYMDCFKSNILLQDTQFNVSHLPSPQQQHFGSVDSLLNSTTGTNDNKMHEFLLMHLTKSFDNIEIKKMYADYKSRGGIAADLNKKRMILNETDNSDAHTHGKNNIFKHLQTDESKNPKNDCLDIYMRQHLAVLFYSQCETSQVYPNICHKPRIINMKFYLENDMTLGSFLARNCFRTGYKCNNELCDTLIVYHTRSFVHEDTKITIRMSVVPTANSTHAGSSNSQQSSINPSSSHENSITNNNTISNKNSKEDIANHSQQQFSNLSVSALSSNFVNKSPRTQGSSNIKQEASKSSEENSMQYELQNNLRQSKNLSNAVIYDDINIFMWSVCKICNKSSKKFAMSPHTWSFSLAKYLELTFHAKNYHQFNGDDSNVVCTHSLFQDHYQYFRFKNIVTVFSTSKISIRLLHLPSILLKSNTHARSRNEYIEEIKDLFEKGLSVFNTLVERISSLKTLNLHENQNRTLDSYIMQINSDSTLRHKIEHINLLLTNQSAMNSPSSPTTLLKSTDLVSNENKDGEHFPEDSIDSIEKTKADKRCSTELSSSPNSIATFSPAQCHHVNINYDKIEILLIDLKKYIANSVNSWNTKMSEFFKKNKYDDVGVISSGSNENPMSTPIDIPSGKQLTNEHVTDASMSLLNDLNNGTPKSNEIMQTATNLSASSNMNVNSNVALFNQEDEHKTKAISIGKRLIANLIPSSAFQPLKYPFPDEEHFLLGYDSKYYVNDKNLSSIVAFTLSTKDYKEFLNNSNKVDFNKIANNNQPQIHTMGLTSLSKENFVLYNSALQDADDFETFNNTSENGSSNRSSKQAETELHFEYQFHDLTTKFYCKAYYAELFSDLRKLIMPNEEEKYIHSLFRCMNWDAKGGKSNSQFRKTLDNRFVLKEMSKQEVLSFLDFAPQYVSYVTDSIKNKKATGLTKILGAYRICLMKNTTISSKAVKMDVIVLENLFYSKKFSQVFDLKGSERNRMVNEKHIEKDIVLLDENFLRWSFDNPIYIKPHSKYVLMKAIENDTQFLSSKFVMDYSLLCGFDQVNNEIVVGIIDYLRVFTWDKKVETYLKTISGPKIPTIVSPEVYRTRFINAIDRYFLEVPDQWYQEKPKTN